MSEYVSCGISILVSKQIVKHYHPEELLHLWHPCRHELLDGFHAVNHLQHTEEIALVLSNASIASLSSMISILPFFAQIYTFYPTFGRKSVGFRPNLHFLPHIWVKIVCYIKIIVYLCNEFAT